MIVQVKATGQQKMEEEEEEDEGNDQLQHTRPNCEDAGLGRIDYGTKLFDSKWSSQVRNSKGASLHIWWSWSSFKRPWYNQPSIDGQLEGNAVTS